MASELYTMNPVKRRGKRKAKRSDARRKTRAARRARRVGRASPVIVAAPVRRRRRSKRALPAQFKRRASRRGSGASTKLSLNNFIEAAKTGALNGLGAFATDIALGFARPMLPTQLGFGPARHLTRVGIGLALSHLTRKFNPKFSNAIAVGTATVAGYDFVKEYIQPLLPAGVVLGEYTGMGEYTTARQSTGTLGYQSSGAVPQPMSGASESAYYSNYN